MSNESSSAEVWGKLIELLELVENRLELLSDGKLFPAPATKKEAAAAMATMCLALWSKNGRLPEEIQKIVSPARYDEQNSSTIRSWRFQM